MDVLNRKIPADVLEPIRLHVLNQWRTGQDVRFQEAVDYHHRLAPQKIFANRLEQARLAGDTLIQPRAGVALANEQIELLQYLEKAGEADLLPTTIDSYTRHNQYEAAENGIRESMRAGRSLLNGFPAVNHGVAVCRLVTEAVQLPVQVRHGTPDARLLAEISLAGGFTSFEGGGISYNIPYAKNNPLEQTIFDWQYVDRLVGLYEEAGVRINREPFGPLTGTLVPPCVSIAVSVIESLLAAGQGVRNISVGYGQCGNLIQDVAAVQALLQLTGEYLQRFGHAPVTVTTVFHQWMGGFPQDEAKAFGVIGWGAAVAVLAGATKVIVKTPHEALGVPTREANAAGLRTTRQLVSMLKDQKMLPSPEIDAEMAIILAETRCILDRVYQLGDEDFARGTVRAFQAGVIDVPFAPSVHNAGKLLPARDNTGAVRLLEIGNLPLDPALIDFHREKMQERARFEKRAVSFQMVIDDIYAISKGRLVGRPR